MEVNGNSFLRTSDHEGTSVRVITPVTLVLLNSKYFVQGISILHTSVKNNQNPDDEVGHDIIVTTPYDPAAD